MTYIKKRFVGKIVISKNENQHLISLVEAKKINHSWSEIVRIGNTQKIIKTIAQKEDNHWLGKRTCSVAEPKLIAFYEALDYEQKHKFVS